MTNTTASNPSLKASNAPNTLPPEFIRLPKSGEREPLTGLSRSTLNFIILPRKANGFRPPVKSKVLKTNAHAKRGARIIIYSSLLEYLYGLPAEAHPPAKEDDAKELTSYPNQTLKPRLKNGQQASDLQQKKASRQ